MPQNPDDAWQHNECEMLQRKEIEATAAAMSDISEEEFGVPCLVWSAATSIPWRKRAVKRAGSI